MSHAIVDTFKGQDNEEVAKHCRENNCVLITYPILQKLISSGKMTIFECLQHLISQKVSYSTAKTNSNYF